MSRALLILSTCEARQKAADWVQKAPAGTRVEFRGPKRTTDQSDKMWAMLTDVATQKLHSGRKYLTDEWKVIFLHALGRETQFIPALDGHGFIPYGQSSSDLSKSEMSDLIELIQSWGEGNGVVFRDSAKAAA